MDQGLLSTLPFQLPRFLMAVAGPAAAQHLAGVVSDLDHVSFVKRPLYRLDTYRQQAGQAAAVEKGGLSPVIDRHIAGGVVICTGQPAFGR